MKNTKLLLFALALVLAIAVCAPAAFAGDEDVPIGTVVGQFYFCPYWVEINGERVDVDDAYVIDGEPVLVAEELVYYGFKVRWDGEARELNISLDTSGQKVKYGEYGTFDTHREHIYPGSYAGDIYATDIVTTVTDFMGDTYEIPSWNLGGWTAVRVDDIITYFKNRNSNSGWDEDRLTYRANLISYTDWTLDLTCPEPVDELTRGFALTVTGLGGDTKVEGEGGWGGVDDVTLTPTGFSFTVSPRVMENYDGCLDWFNTDIAAYDSLRDGSPANRIKGGKPDLTVKLFTYILDTESTYLDSGKFLPGELWIEHLDGGAIRYTYRFTEPLTTERANVVYIAIGAPLFVAERFFPADTYYSHMGWTGEWYPELVRAYSTPYADVYYCTKAFVDDKVYVVWPDGSYGQFVPPPVVHVGFFGFTISDFQVSDDEKSISFYASPYGKVVVDLITGERTTQYEVDPPNYLVGQPPEEP